MLTQKQLELWFCWVCFLFYPRDLFVVPMVNSAALKKPLGPAVQTSYPQLEKVQLPVSNNNIWRTEWWLGGGGGGTDSLKTTGQEGFSCQVTTWAVAQRKTEMSCGCWRGASCDSMAFIWSCDFWVNKIFKAWRIESHSRALTVM